MPGGQAYISQANLQNSQEFVTFPTAKTGVLPGSLLQSSADRSQSRQESYIHDRKHKLARPQFSSHEANDMRKVNRYRRGKNNNFEEIHKREEGQRGPNRTRSRDPIIMWDSIIRINLNRIDPPRSIRRQDQPKIGRNLKKNQPIALHTRVHLPRTGLHSAGLDDIMHSLDDRPVLRVQGVAGIYERRNVPWSLLFHGPPIIPLHVGHFSGA
jgi:hypothetical protein